MCGIIGQIEWQGTVDKTVFDRMRDTLTHRGPDDAGTWISDNQKTALGHRRLSFLDLSAAGHQPMPNEEQNLWLTFNGEIYNFQELRSTLLEKGHTFRSTSDSEVILHGYEEWGAGIVEKLDGMFGFGLWDDSRKELFLARDRFGIKPLYYFQNEERLIFGSELKAVVGHPGVPRNPDFSAFCDFLVYRYVPEPKTIWKNTFKVKPAHYLKISQNGKIEEKRYWDIFPGNANPKFSEAAKKTDLFLENSVRGHIQADVPIGSFLSGGFDSSAMVYYMNRLKTNPETFSIGFENWPESEHQFAEMVALQFGNAHQNIVIGAESLSLVEKLATFYDEPIGDISIIPTYVVSWSAARKVKAVLSGEGADEMFCGYSWQKQLPEKATAEDLVDYYANAMSMGWFGDKELREILHPRLHAHIPEDVHWFYRKHLKPDWTPLKAVQYLDLNTFMRLVLTKVDRASMANSLEVRVPFLDHRLQEYVFGLDEKVYFSRTEQKPLLKANLQGRLPDQILGRKKQGFVGPDKYYEDLNFYRKKLKNSHLVRDEIVNRKGIDRLLEDEDYWRLWKVTVLEFWYRRWMGTPDSHAFS